MIKLTPKREKFSQEVANGKTASDALRIAFKVSKTHTDKSVWERSSRLMNDVKVKSRIEELRVKVMERQEITRERVLKEIARLALSDMRGAFKENGDLLDVKDWPDDVAAAISSIKIHSVPGPDGDQITIKEVKFWDKNSAADKLCKFLGLYETDNRQKNPLEDLSRDTLKLLKERLSGK